jgi:hypothetical protein
MRLGEALVKSALITPSQLKEALNRQAQFGGRIGTNLIELQYITEEELSRFMSKYFKLPAADPDTLNSIPDDIIKLINSNLVEKYKIVPFKKERNRLHTAMLNPKDLKSIDELRFITGYDIIPYVITEIRLLYCIEKYYGIKRDLRYISLTDRLNPEDKIEDDFIEKVKISFTEVKDPEEVAGILINEAYKIAPRVGLFTLKGGKIMGWKSKGMEIGDFSINENETNVFSDVLRSKNIYRGPILNVKGNLPLIDLLSGSPQDALIIPISIREKIVALLYVDNGNNSVLNANVGYLSMLSSMASIAFEIIILKRRILEMGKAK